MSQFHVGYGGGVTIDAVELCITKWTMKRSQARVEIITQCGRTNLGSIPDASGTIEFPYDSDAPEPFDVGDTVDVSLELGDSGDAYEGTVFIESMDHSSENSGTAPVMVVANWVANLSVGTPIMTHVPAA